MNLSASGMRSGLSIDITNRRLEFGARYGNFNPIGSEIQSNHETDKQNEDNATWFFEYKALLNSRLTTLTTALTSAYTTDLDAAMGKQAGNGVNWGKAAMQGKTGELSDPGDTTSTTIVDPGAARTAVAYFGTYSNTFGNPAGNWAGTAATQAANVSVSINIGGGTVSGTTGFLNGSEMDLDILDIASVTATNVDLAYDNAKPEDDFDNPLVYSGKLIGNNMEKVLYDFFSKRQNIDLLKFGMFENIFVVGTSSLPTGSQVQGSISLNFDKGAGTGFGQIKIVQERFAAFFHS